MYAFMLKGRWAENPLDILDKGDYVVLEYKSPKWRERVRRNFEVNIIGEDIIFENSHANIYAKVGAAEITDKVLKKIRLISIMTKEYFEAGMNDI